MGEQHYALQFTVQKYVTVDELKTRDHSSAGPWR